MKRKPPPRLLTVADVARLRGLSKREIYHLICHGTFIPQVVLTERNRGWDEDKIQDWLLQILEDSEQGD